MDFAWMLACLVYLVLSVSIVGSLPSAFFVGGNEALQQKSYSNPGFNQYVNSSGSSPDNVVSQVGFLGKVAKFLFVTWSISGIPAIIGALLFIVNVATIIIPVLFIVDLVRGRP